MKTNTKKLVQISLGLIVSGIVLTGAGMLFGGRPGVAISKNGVRSPYKHNNPCTLEKTKLDPFSDMKLKIGSYADIRILPSEDDKFYLEYTLNGDYGEPSCEVKGDSLVFTHSGGSKGGEFYLINFDVGDIFSEDVFHVNTAVTLYIPERKDMGSLDIYNDCGNVSIKGITFGDAKLDVSYGDVKLEDVNFGDLELDMESGGFKAETLTARNLLLKNEYGNISLEDITAEDAQLEMESGSLKAKGLTSENLNVKADYGSVDLKEFKGETAEFVLESGDLNLDAKAITSLTCRNAYGDVRLQLPKEITDYSIDAHSEYGSIKLPPEIEGYHASSGTEAVYRSEGKAKGTIQVEVESGDIVIN